MLQRAVLAPLFAAGFLSTSALAADVSQEYESYAPSPGEDYGQAQWVVGHLDFGIGWRFPESDVFDADSFGLGNGFGRANIPLFGGLNFEAEIGGWVAVIDGDAFNTFEGIGHLWLRSPMAAGGIFGGWTSYFGTDIPTLGAEGQVYLGNLTLGAQGSYNWDDGGNDVWGVRGDADFYLNPDLRIGGNVQFWDVGGPDTWVVGADVEKRFTGTPISAGASLSYFEGEDFAAWTVLGHLRIFMDPPGSTLQWHDREVPFAFSLPLFGG